MGISGNYRYAYKDNEKRVKAVAKTMLPELTALVKRGENQLVNLYNQISTADNKEQVI